jgi:hypothetical protein
MVRAGGSWARLVGRLGGKGYGEGWWVVGKVGGQALWERLWFGLVGKVMVWLCG